MSENAWKPADPVPLGIAGFALTTFILGLVNVGVLGNADTFIVLSVAAAYGGLVQLLAGMWAFAERNTFAAVAFSSYGGFWISFVLLIQFFLPEAAKSGITTADHGLGIYLFCWGYFTFYMWIASFRTNVALNFVFLTLWIAYLILGLVEFNIGGPNLHKAGGAVTALCAVAAWYVSVAHVLNAYMGRTVVPLGPLTRITVPAQ